MSNFGLAAVHKKYISTKKFALVNWNLLYIFLFCSLSNIQDLIGQVEGQLWTEYIATRAFTSKFKAEGRVGYRTNIEQPRWRTVELRGMPEYKINKHFELLATLQYFETLNEYNPNTAEIREGIGAKIHFSPDYRIDSRLLLRGEQRNVFNKELKSWKHSTRGRIRAELQAPISKTTMKSEKVWYGLTDIEVFLLVDTDVQERYSNRMRARVGIGYKLSDWWQFEIIYMYQKSIDNFQSDEETYDSILRIRIKQVFGRND